MDLERQEYSLRLSPLGFWETRNDRKVMACAIKLSFSQKNILLNQSLLKRYLTLIDLILYRNLNKINENLRVLYEDRLKVLKARSSSSDFSIKDIVASEERCSGICLKIAENSTQIKNLEESIIELMTVKGPIDLDETEIITIDDIRKRPGLSAYTINKNNIYLKESMRKVSFEKSRFDYEIAKNRRYLSFFELSYETRERFNDNVDLSVEVGIEIPIVKRNQMQVNGRKLSYMDSKGEYNNLKKELEQRVRLYNNELDKLIRQNGILNSGTGETDKSYKTYLGIDGVDPLTLLDIKEKILKRQAQSENIRHSLYCSYFQLMEITGNLVKGPVRNCLSRKGEELKIWK